MLIPFSNHKPSGVTITDSFNHIDYPYKNVTTDKGSNIEYNKLRYFIISDGRSDISMTKQLPYHWVIEYYKENYIFNNTRSVIYKYYPPRYSSMEDSYNMNHIQICIIGDSSVDVYNSALYQKIYTLILEPLTNLHKISFQNSSNLDTSRMGKGFVREFLMRYV